MVFGSHGVVCLPFTSLDNKKNPYDLIWENDELLCGKVNAFSYLTC